MRITFFDYNDLWTMFDKNTFFIAIWNIWNNRKYEQNWTIWKETKNWTKFEKKIWNFETNIEKLLFFFLYTFFLKIGKSFFFEKNICGWNARQIVLHNYSCFMTFRSIFHFCILALWHFVPHFMTFRSEFHFCSWHFMYFVPDMFFFFNCISEISFHISWHFFHTFYFLLATFRQNLKFKSKKL